MSNRFGRSSWVEEGQTYLSDDVAQRRGVFSVVFGGVKRLGEGTDRGSC